jgi:hypothetical protein
VPRALRSTGWGNAGALCSWRVQSKRVLAMAHIVAGAEGVADAIGVVALARMGCALPIAATSGLSVAFSLGGVGVGAGIASALVAVDGPSS